MRTYRRLPGTSWHPCCSATLLGNQRRNIVEVSPTALAIVLSPESVMKQLCCFSLALMTQSKPRPVGCAETCDVLGDSTYLEFAYYLFMTSSSSG